jgi:DNA invertase Pin-like site-specific DNA recombinase
LRTFAAYYRVSKDSHESGRSKSKGLGLDAQKQIAWHYFKGIKAEFTEVKSAKNVTDRPVLREAINYCLTNDMWLAVAKLDRLSRNVDDVREIIKALDGKVVFGDIPSEGNADLFTITIFAAFAERERELISLRTSQALREKIKREGYWNKNSAKAQAHQEKYFKSGKMNELSVIANKAKARNNENTIRAAEVIKSCLKEGINYNQIAKILNDSMHTTPMGKQFASSQVKRIHEKHIL